MVSKFIAMKLFYYIILLSCLFSERGDVYSVELLEYKTVSEIQSEISDYLDGQGDYDEMVFKGIAATRQLAKRQLTWLRGWQNITWLESGDEENLQRVLSSLS